MSVQSKPDYKIFADGAKPGEVVTFPDVLRGWGVTLDTTGGIPPMEFFNSFGKRLNEWLMYLTQRGIPDWDALVDYPKSAMVMFGDNFYVSLKQTKGESPSTSQQSWKKFSDFFGIDGKLAKDQNGADILDKEAFIKNLGLPEKYQAVGYSYSKTESNNNFQPKGSYQPTGNYLNKDSKDVQVVSGEIQSKERVGTIFGDSNLCFLGSYNGKAVIGTYDGVNFRYAVHPNKTGTMALTSDLFGIEQQWYDLKNERSVGVNYQNNTAKPICLFVRLGSSQFQTTEIKVSGKTVGLWTSLGTTASTTSQGAFTIIPPGDSYAVIANQGSSNIIDWVEFR